VSERKELGLGAWEQDGEVHLDLTVLRLEAGVPPGVSDEELMPLVRHALVEAYGEAGRTIPIELET
jgi:hypothetical protein